MTNLDELSKARILVIGDVMLDRYWWGTVNRISPEAPVPIVRLERSTIAPGGAANVALNIAGLGAKPLLIGAVGNDADADVLSAELENRGVGASSLLRLNGRPTSVKTRIIAHSQQVVRVDSESSTRLTDEHEQTARSTISKALSDVDIVIVSDYAKGFLTSDLLMHLIGECRRASIKVFVDPKGKDYTKYRGATLLTPNRREAAEACNLEEDGAEMIELAGSRLVSDLDIKAILVTRGEEGMTLFRDGAQPVHLPALARHVYDVTGAGDTVIATLATAVGAGADLEEAAKLANIAAGLVVEQIGTSAITLEGLRKHLADNSSLQESYSLEAQ